MLEDTDGHTANQVDEQDQQTGDGVTANEFAGTVHRTVELGLLGHFRPTRLGLRLIDQAGVGIASRVNRALTSEIRPAPLVTTTKLMIIRIAKTTIPTT